ncbi:MAG: hypothetical protein NTZ74_05560 [Chloroflexi bacterium]|nr:hypothetical protein [Chloroflexota bacterium]
MSRILKIISHDISRSFLIGFVALLIVIPAAILFIVLLYENNHNTVSDGFLILAGVVWMGVFLGGMILFIATTSYRRKKWLDSVFNPLGFTGHRYMINWWQYRGTLSGREVTARFYKGPTLDLILSTSLQTRFGVAAPNPLEAALANGLHKPPLKVSVPELQGMTVYALDEVWFTRLCESAEFAGCLARLLHAGESWAFIQQVILSPRQLQLTLYRNKNLFKYDFTAGEVKAWLDDLLALLSIAEASPAPLITAKLSNLEKSARSGNLTRRAVWIVIGFFLVIGACFGLVLWFLVRFAG